MTTHASGGYTYSFQLCDSPQAIEASEEGMVALLEGLGRNILHHLGPVELGRSLRLFLRDPEGNVAGGAVGELFGGWLYVSLLWVEQGLRGRGHGRELIGRLEREAARLGCKHAHVDTYSFEARPFYERLGYEVFAALDDYPEGYSKYFLKKALTRAPE
ncbi:MAG TPA: GNAT family N-acetyltransferase [Anaerolineae bacterium]|nr:GNAT family N-acetyltransferase [Anaerolineae bacterium]